VPATPVHSGLTTNLAAAVLNVSRQYLVRLLDDGQIPCSKVGTHRRIRIDDLMAYKGERDAKRRDKLCELTQASQELGLY
jgi:excisionase family DNA binding protein